MFGTSEKGSRLLPNVEFQVMSKRFILREGECPSKQPLIQEENFPPAPPVRQIEDYELEIVFPGFEDKSVNKILALSKKQIRNRKRKYEEEEKKKKQRTTQEIEDKEKEDINMLLESCN